MKFIDVDKDNQLVFATANQPEIVEDECLIKVKAIGVNRADLLQRAGQYPPPAGESEILGLEVCGDIALCGPAVNNRQVGDKVFGLVPGGGYGEYAKVKAGQLFQLPQDFSYAQGAATAEVFLTAFQSLFSLACLQKSETVLIHAGASGVGTAAIILAKLFGCEVTVTAGTEEKLAACQALGADHLINYRAQDFVQWKKAHQPAGYDVILDVVGGSYLNKNISAAALDGRIIMLAMLGGRYSESLDIAKLLLKRLTLKASTLRNRSDEYKAQLVRDFNRYFGEALQQGKIKPVIDQVYPWQDADHAHSRMANCENIGKLVLSLE
ncbi:NAD(P)H-quinone oxidoreductase [Thalassomonas actiniarum]|uniref:NAD(P)H-quinone oxidoreductase n=1 Tax=Thalassomonas actiniarum TaxID=485447 RepID=A0AAE9YV67_9GAMM|nr:NAD(P)H-quinone oxidoreductase [Thalassomonas actiniarum]WDE01428.1 NAD(P)H-quinone oxidoreductase [Thalassomonas actiniarum]